MTKTVISKKRFMDSDPEANRMRVKQLQRTTDTKAKHKQRILKRRFKRNNEIGFFRHLIQLHMHWPRSDIMGFDEIGLAESAIGLTAPPYGEPLGSQDGRIMRLVQRLIDLGLIAKGSWDHAEMFKFRKRMTKIEPCLRSPVRLGRMRIRLTPEALKRLKAKAPNKCPCGTYSAFYCRDWPRCVRP